ncbi:hypothetical protein [Endozoicomonas elysicola]|uniref:Uncharacterized protein n=1 Tax=Endozoicomonas elysicola TaxID=305900 RepID=A0A081K7S9_9GAMM|nr:hypothetical protein [Endozoicomonas elysicola]KEI70205.1 hypothetical protein GV64_05110 [Endozoicomonas elysicola]
MLQALGHVFHQHNADHIGANPGVNQNAQQQNNASSNGYTVKAMNGIKSAFSNLASAIPSPSSFSFTEKVEIVATGTIYLSQTAFAMANATDNPGGVNGTMGANGSEPIIPDEGGSRESGWPGWKTGLTVVGVAAGVIGIPLTAYCAWQNREKLCPSEQQPIPTEPADEPPIDRELKDMSSKAADEETPMIDKELGDTGATKSSTASGEHPIPPSTPGSTKHETSDSGVSGYMPYQEGDMKPETSTDPTTSIPEKVVIAGDKDTEVSVTT